jgi:sugar phosphate isomerase/epimerase
MSNTRNFSRRSFTALSAASAAFAQNATMAPAWTPMPDIGGIRLGVCSYSFREFSRRMAINMTKQLRTPYINLKEFHLLYRSTPEELAAGKKQIESAGLSITGGGTVYMMKEDEADVRHYFEYAKAAGMPLMVVGPTARTLPIIEKHVKQYNIAVAIHNHGPEDKHFPSCRDALKIIKDMDPRMGICLDIGHEIRAGYDLLESVALCGPRLLDLHIKDSTDLKTPKGVPVGDGLLPIVPLLKELRKRNYKGCVNLEYEVEGDNPMPGMLKSFSYMRGVLAGLAG